MPSIQTEIYPMVSSNEDTRFLLSEILGQDHVNDWVNPFNPLMFELLSLPRQLVVKYINNVPITTLSWELYGTTTLWYLILICSNYNHPQYIPNNTEIRLPTADALYTTMIEAKKDVDSLSGKVITF